MSSIHRDHRPVRGAVTLVEVLIVIAILGVLVAITLSAIQKSRMMALRLNSMNNMRQIMLAIQNYSSAADGDLPTIVDVMKPNQRDLPPFRAALPYLESNRRIFISPADPSLNYVNPDQPLLYDLADYSSYGYNAVVFTGNARLPASIPDGTSHTIGISEHYARCARDIWVEFVYSLNYSAGDGGHRRASFSDRYYGDVVPITSGSPPKTVPSVPGKTFQTRPLLNESDASVPQTPHTGGMLAAMMDGSVRSLASAMAPDTFWSLVTPNGGEVIDEQ